MGHYYRGGSFLVADGSMPNRSNFHHRPHVYFPTSPIVVCKAGEHHETGDNYAEIHGGCGDRRCLRPEGEDKDDDTPCTGDNVDYGTEERRHSPGTPVQIFPTPGILDVERIILWRFYLTT